MKNNQRASMDVDDVSGRVLEPPLPPDKPAQRPTEPPSIKLEVEKKLDMSCNEALTDDDAHATGVSGRVEDAENVSKDLRSTSEQVSKRSK